MFKIRDSGFSLIELLISVTIITMTIALTNLIYANYVQNDIRFASRSDLYMELPDLVEQIRHKIKQEYLEKGELIHNQTVCNWTTENKQEAGTVSFNAEIGKAVNSAEQMYLYHLLVNCELAEYKHPPFLIKVLVIDNSFSGVSDS